jgi:flagellar basal body rod protein FlgG
MFVLILSKLLTLEDSLYLDKAKIIKEMPILIYYNRDVTKTRMELDDKDVIVINADTKLLDADGKTLQIGADAIDGKIAVGDQVKVDKNVITLVLTKAQVTAAKTLNDDIKAYAKTVDTLAYADKAAVDALNAKYTALTDAQKAFVEKSNVDKLTALVNKMAELAEEPELIAAIAAANDTLALSKALANPLFKTVDVNVS